MMDSKLRELIIQDINRLIIQLLDLAEEKHISKVDEYGTKTLDRIPMELLIYTSITCIAREHMKQLLQDIQLRYLNKQLMDAKELWNVLDDEIRKILRIYFVDVYKEEDEVEYARIIGYSTVGVCRRIVCFSAIVLFEACYERRQMEDIDTIVKDYIWIPFVAKVVSGMEKRIKVWEEPDERRKWEKAARQHMEEKVGDSKEILNMVRKNITDMQNQMKYVVGGKRDAKEIFGEVQFGKAEKCGSRRGV